MVDACRITVENTGESFACGSGEYVLDAGLNAGLKLPHSCRGGACGACKVEVLEGEVDHGWVNSFGITDEEKAAGLCLACQSKPRTAALRIRALADMQAASAGDARVVPVELRATVVASHPVTPTIREVSVLLPQEVDFRYRAGMNMEIAVPGVHPSRTYSMASTPDADGRAVDRILTFYVTRHSQGAASGWIHDSLRVGADLEMRGPYGDFSVPADLDEACLLLAGGSGLSPVLAIATRLLADGFALPVDLVVSVRTASEVFALRELAALAARHGNFRWHVTLSRETPPAGRRGWYRGRVPEMLLAAVPDAVFRRTFVAGPPAFVEACRDHLLGQGVAPGAISLDSYLPAATAA